MFQPKTEYDIIPDKFDVRDFHDYPDSYVVRPPYQRKSVWPVKKQQSLLDSLFRRYYIPKLVLREVRLQGDKAVYEVVDGQQRICTVQNFFADRLRLPDSLKTLDKRLPGAKFSELPDDVKKFAGKTLKYDVDIIKNIDNPKSPAHQTVATEIFWRLQQGEPLNFMEKAHARLASLVRNFIVKYADDISFDFEKYEPLDVNPHVHPFFRVLDQNNNRMQNLSLMGRLLLIEIAGGPTDIRDGVLAPLVDGAQVDDGIGNYNYENEASAKSLLKTMELFYRMFKDDPAIDDENGVKELRIEYFIISLFMLLRHLRLNYALEAGHLAAFRDFTYQFHQRWKLHKEDDLEIQIFQNNRQQSEEDLANRDHIIRQLFFEYLTDKGVIIKGLDSKRAFNEAERIRIYRKQSGLCQMCKVEGKSDEDARVSWKVYQADHIMPWVKGGKTSEENAQVLCSTHNAQKGGR